MSPLTPANHRFSVDFRKEHCRLSSDQFILEVPGSKWGLFLAIPSKILLFGLPDYYEARFKSHQFADVSSWPEYVFETIDDLKQTRSWVRWTTAAMGTYLLTKSSKVLALLGSEARS